MALPLKIDTLVKNYGDFRAVDQVSFEVRPGEIFGLLGPNGAGKTSIISCVVTLQEPSSGEISVFGKDPLKESLESKSLVGFVPQEIVNHGYFNVYEILEFYSGYFRKWKNKEKIEFLLHRLGLWEHRFKRVRLLSGGMKRRLMIAKALVHDPKILLLDEPTAGVDIELRASLWEFVEDLRKEGMSILLTTHYLEEAEQLCDRVGILQEGRLRTVGETGQLIAQATQRRVTITTEKDLKHPQLVNAENQSYEFLLPSKKPVGELLQELDLSMNQLMDIQIHEGSLEDAFIQVLGEDA